MKKPDASLVEFGTWAVLAALIASCFVDFWPLLGVVVAILLLIDKPWNNGPGPDARDK